MENLFIILCIVCISSLLISLLWIFVESIVRGYYSFYGREYVPSWLTINFHLLFSAICKISIVFYLILYIPSIISGEKGLTDIGLTAIIAVSILLIKPDTLKLYDQGKREKTGNT